jgi:sugar (pentulose or hexulose) kinase
VLLIGGAAKNSAVQLIAADLLGQVIHVPPPGEYVADGAAKQAAWAIGTEMKIPEMSNSTFVAIEPSNSFHSEEIAFIRHSYLKTLHSSSDIERQI